jgi:hypothetical protein
MKTKKFFFCFVGCLFYSVLLAQTIYGVHGLIKIPDAYTVKNGGGFFTGGYFYDYFRPYEPNLQRPQWSASLLVGFHSRVELGARLTGVPSVKVRDSTYQFTYYIDRIINTKVILLKEKKWVPQLAVGFQDLVGTRLFNSTYIALSKEFKWKDSLMLQMTLGYGTKLTNYILGPATNHRFIGLFGGVQWHCTRWGALQAEQDGRDINYGIKITPFKWLGLEAFGNFKRNIGGLLWLKFNL